MSFIERIQEKAKESIKKIVLPESSDIRVIEAARKVTDLRFCKSCPNRKQRTTCKCCRYYRYIRY